MTALAANRNIARVGEGIAPDLSFGVAASTLLYKGALVGIDESGYANDATTSPLLRVTGIAIDEADNSAGLANAISVNVKQGVFYFKNSTGGDAIAADDFGKPCYAVDDQTVALTGGEGTGIRPLCGTIVGYDSTLGVAVLVGAVNQGARLQKLEQTIEHGDLTAAATTEAVALGTLPAGAWVLDHEIYITTLFSGGSVATCTLDIGGTDTDAIVDGHDVFTGAATGRLRGSTLGVHPTGYFSSQAMVATFTSTTDNLVNLSAGALVVTILYIVL
jgi:hypothetical protein